MNIQHFSKNYGALRYVALSTLVVALISNGIWAYLFIQEIHRQTEKVYVATPRTTYPAALSKLDRPSIFEVKNHVKQFMYLMFGHDEHTFKKHMEAALHLIDKEEGLAIFHDFEAGEVYDNYLKYGSRAYFECEAVNVEIAQEPYTGKVYGQQMIHYKDQKQPLPIAATFELVRTRRSESNPFGLLLKNWKFVEYPNMKTPQTD